MGSAPFLSTFAWNSLKTPLMLVGVDIAEFSSPYAKHNVSKALYYRNQYRHTPDDSMDIRQENWKTTLSTGERFDVIYFNPPYLPQGEVVRLGMTDVPEETIYVKDSTDGLDHYREVLPLLKETIMPEGLIVVRTPNDVERFLKIRAMAEEIFDDTEATKAGFTIHSASVKSIFGDRDGKGLIIQAAAREAIEYSVEPFQFCSDDYYHLTERELSNIT